MASNRAASGFLGWRLSHVETVDRKRSITDQIVANVVARWWPMV